MSPSRGVHDDSHGHSSAADLGRTETMNDEYVVRPPHATDRDQSDHAAPEQIVEQPQFTLRAVLCGLVIGILIAFSNTYFGLQTGWISGMAMPSALIGFAYFKGLNALMHAAGGKLEQLGFGAGFSEVENVLVQTVAGSVGTMPLGCGFVGIVPALEFLLNPDEVPELSPNGTQLAFISSPTAGAGLGGFRLPLGKLILWALGLCFFGVLFAVPLRKEVIIREKLKFPSGTATALVIRVLHGGEKPLAEGSVEQTDVRSRNKQLGDEAENDGLLQNYERDQGDGETRSMSNENDPKRDWKRQIRLLSVSFGVSGFYTILSYFMPQLHTLPIFGSYLANKWLWSFNPSPAYIAQGIIMGPSTTIHMFIGAVLGWAILSPLAKHQGWAAGEVSDWNHGSKGWIVWISLAIMLADAIVSLSWLVLRGLIYYGTKYGAPLFSLLRTRGFNGTLLRALKADANREEALDPYDEREPMIEDRLTSTNENHPLRAKEDGDEEDNAPPEHQINMKMAAIGLLVSIAFCVSAIQFSFSGIIPIGSTLLALVLAMLLSIMGVRALGETDLNPVSGISKLTQLIFALVTPRGSRNAVTINLLAGAISESGALQAGDLLQDLKTGHLLGASPKAQFYGQLIGSAVGAVVSACVYKLYTTVYDIPGGLFQVPTGYVWVFTARLVTGRGLPPHVDEWAGGAAFLWVILTVLRIYGQSRRRADGSKGAWWVPYVPGGIAVAVGMYNTPSFTLARTVGGVLLWWWTSWKKRAETPMIVLASGLILGEGLLSIVNLGLASAKVPHL